ncbi:MAG: amino acid adenylation domain-containing protein, partial [Lutisporaceae bacterium]
ERSAEMIIGIMGIIKAGGAYLPIDPEYPNDRIAYMLQDSKANILLTQTHLANKGDFGIELIDLKDNSIYMGDNSNLDNINTSNNLVYTIYTSGSTGKPKGVMVEHKNLVNLVYGLKERIYKENKNLKVAMVSPYVFDASVKQIFPALLLGHTLCIIPEDTRLDANKLFDYYTNNSIDVADGTPTHLKMLTGLDKQAVDIGIKQFVIGGEALSTELVEEYYSKYNKNCIINNVYGPTECCDVTTVFSVTSNMQIKSPIVPIGYPIPNAKVYIVNSYNKAVPIGVLGELCISGAGVSRGYLNNAELTSEKFVDNPYDVTQKMYKTGDLVRWSEDGNIEFLGRIDNQVKIRGYRIELGEIEARILSFEGIEEVIVIARDEEGGNNYLCAYISGIREFTISEFREYLAKDLPEYMIPAYLIQLDQLPLTTNGKVDRKALPEPDGSINTGVAYSAPTNEIEEKLTAIWQKALSIEKVGINDNFFELGGHSLKAINVIAKIHKELNVELPLRELFKTPTIKNLAKYIEGRAKSASTNGNRILLLREGVGSTRNLFLIHDGSGDISGYLELCNKLDNTLSCWGIMAGSEELLAPYNTTFEMLAKDYIDNIKAIQPKGPYLLGGWSMGGTIAYEITRQLERDGEKVKSLTLIDSYPPESEVRMTWPQITLEGEKTLTAMLINSSIVREMIVKADSIEKIWDTIAEYMGKSDVELEKAKLMLPSAIGMLIPEQGQSDAKCFINRLNIIRTLLSAADQYTTKERIKASVYLVKTSDSTALNTKAWNLISETPVQVSEIEGDHFSIMKGNRAEKLAVMLNEILEQSVANYRMLKELNNTKTCYPRDMAIHQCFEAQAEMNPERIAVIYKDRQLTYRELNEKANQLAALLKASNIEKENIVCLLIDKSPEMVIGTLAILKVGAAYLPIDYEYPEARIKHMLKDSKAVAVLTNSSLAGGLNWNGKIICLDEESNYTGSKCNLDCCVQPNNLAYIMYTSGSTGEAKGVMVEHRNVVRLVKNTNYIDFAEGGRILQAGAIAFDAATFEIWGALLNGLRLYLCDKETILDAEKLGKALKDYQITILLLTSSLFNQLAQQEPGIFSPCHWLLVGGDVLSPKHINNVRNMHKNLKVVNAYGPTENATISTCFLIDRDYYDNIPIGKPIANSTAYILNSEGELLPFGEIGELHVGGDGLARGYLGKTELTAERFVSNPFVQGERLYKTGDLVKWNKEGNIEFMGRKDNQIKLRGFRIELEEIENKLTAHEAILEAVVLVRTDETGDKYLSTCFTADKPLTAQEIREYLGQILPAYMIPVYFIQIDKIPLTPTGKADRKALNYIADKLEMDMRIEAGVEYEAPRSEIEEKLVQIWEDILNIPKIGIGDNFFELGGHSLKATNIAANINKELNVSVPITEMFKTPTIKGLADYVKNAQQSVYTRIEPIEEKEYYELSSAQKRMYIIHQLDEDGISYNLPMMMSLEGEPDKTKLKETFDKLIQRHEALRTSFEVINGAPVQIVHKDVNFEIEYTEVANDNEKAGEIAARFIKAFDLSKAPLIRVALTKINDKEHVLMIDMHHIISDGVSMELFTKDFTELYDNNELTKLRIQYKDFAVWQNGMFKYGQIKQQEEYWLKTFEREAPVLNMLTDYQRPNIQSFEGDSIGFELSEELTDKLKQVAKETVSTMYMILLSACNILLSKYSGQEDIIIGSPIAGRPHADLQNIMGMFVNTLAMRNYPDGNKTFKEFLTEVKTSSLQAFESQDYQFEELIDKLNITRDLSRNPLFDVVFSMQNMEAGELKIGGLNVKPYEIDIKIAQFDITITAIESSKTIGLSLNYCTKLFSKRTMQNMSKHLINILNSISNNTELRLSEVEMLSEEEKHQLLVEFNNKISEYPKDKTIQQLFEEQAEKTPNNIAVVYKKYMLTYKALNEKANKIASLLRNKGIRSNEIVGIMVEGSTEMLVGILGILKAGAAYLPIDPKYPIDRIAYMIEDSKTRILLTDFQPKDMLGENTELILLKDEELYKGENANLEIINTPKDIAYVIYTSGSTGKPKGVMIEHSSLINLCKWHIDYYEVTEKDNSTKYAGFGFDAS